LLLALKIEYPENVHLIRGNHEAADINALFGFRLECIERMGENDGIWAWTRFNQLFNYLPLAALIENKIICMHGGIGRSISTVEQIEKIERPITMDAGSLVLMDLLWSDPTENDSIEGLRPNARGPGLVTFGPDRVTEFCKRNKLQLIIRAHECVMDGFERFAQGQLITLFSATNYCGEAKQNPSKPHLVSMIVFLDRKKHQEIKHCDTFLKQELRTMQELYWWLAEDW
jgi:protein phosphatase